MEEKDQGEEGEEEGGAGVGEEEGAEEEVEVDSTEAVHPFQITQLLLNILALRNWFAEAFI